MVARLVQEDMLRPVPGQVRNRQFVAQDILRILGAEET
jgi:hypothetical protein